MTPPEPPRVVVAVHHPFLAEALGRVLQRGLAIPEQRPPGDAVDVITLDREPDPEASYVLCLPETVGDPAVLRSAGGAVSLVLSSLEDVAGLVNELLRGR